MINHDSTASLLVPPSRSCCPSAALPPERDRLTVLFERAGYKTLSLETAQRRGLLTKA
jgi:hypothetical protein